MSIHAQSMVWSAVLVNDPEYLAERHELANCAESIEQVSAALANLARAAVSNELGDKAQKTR